MLSRLGPDEQLLDELLGKVCNGKEPLFFRGMRPTTASWMPLSSV